MKSTRRLTALIEKEDDVFVSFCPELDIASQGSTIEEATANLKEALTLFLAGADYKLRFLRSTVHDPRSTISR